MNYILRVRYTVSVQFWIISRRDKEEKNSMPRMTKYAHIPKISYTWAYLVKASNSSDILREVMIRP